MARAGIRLLWRAAVALAGLVLVLCLALGIFVLTNPGRQVAAPEWLRTAISDRISAQVPQFDARFETLSVVVPDDLSLHLRVGGVTVSKAGGPPVATLSGIEANLSLTALARGVLQPTVLRASGSGLVLQRQADGSVTLSGNAIGGAGRPMGNFVELLDVVDVLLNRPNLQKLRLVEARNLSLRYEDVKADRAWSADDGIIRMQRDGDRFELTSTVVLLGDRAYPTEVAASYSGVTGGPEGRFGFTLTDMPSLDLVGQTPALDWLSVIDAPLSGALRGQVRADGTLGPLNATLNIGAGVIRPAPTVRDLEFRKASSYFTYDPATGAMTISELSLSSEWVDIAAEGRAQVTGAAGSPLSGMLAQVRVRDIRLTPAEFYPQPLVIDRADIAARLSFAPFRVELGQLALKSGDQDLRARGSLNAGPDGWHADLRAQARAMTPAALLRMWPNGVKDDITTWISEHILEGVMQDVSAALSLDPGTEPVFSLGFSFEDLKMLHANGLPPITAAAGHASLHAGRFTVLATRGHVPTQEGGQTDISGTAFVIPDVDIRDGPAEVRLRTRGPLTSVLSLIDTEPLALLRKAGRRVSLATGQAVVSGLLGFDLKKEIRDEDVAVALTATLTDVHSTELVEGHDLSAPQLALSLADNTLAVSGAAAVSGVPVDFRWQGGLGPEAGGRSHLDGTVTLSAAALDAFGIGLPPGMVSGSGPAALALDLEPGDRGQFRLETDLRGLGLKVPEIGWAMSAGQVGRLTVAGTLGKPVRVDDLRLEAPGLSLAGSVRLKPGGDLEAVSFRRARVGNWLDAPVDLVGRGRNVPPAIRVRGGRLDLRHEEFGKGGGSGGEGGAAAVPVSVALDTVQLSDTLALTQVRTELQVAGGATGLFTGRVNGRAPVSGEIRPHRGRMAVTVRSPDAGAVMASAGLVQNAAAGQMLLTLIPASATGVFNGKLDVQNVSIRDAPALAALLNSLSIVGLLNELTGEGIYFSTVAADFQLAPDRLTITEASAVGASMGISLDGYYFPRTRRLDVQGVFSPIYVLNAVGRIFSRRGEGLIGFNYALTGPVDSPNVQVNPLSMFTPGMFRDIFRRDPPEVKR